MPPSEELWWGRGYTETKDHSMASHPPDDPGSLSLESLHPPHRGSGDREGKAAVTKLAVTSILLCSRLRDPSKLVV